MAGGAKRLDDFFADLAATLPERGAYRGKEIFRPRSELALHRANTGNRRGPHGATPPRMHGSDYSGCRVRDQDGRAVCHSHTDRRGRIAADEDVGFGKRPEAVFRGAADGDGCAVHLSN